MELIVDYINPWRAQAYLYILLVVFMLYNNYNDCILVLLYCSVNVIILL